jgi:hypothetical protein
VAVAHGELLHEQRAVVVLSVMQCKLVVHMCMYCKVHILFKAVFGVVKVSGSLAALAVTASATVTNFGYRLKIDN